MNPTLLERRQGPFYDPFEALEPAEKEVVVRDRLQELVNFASSRSPFYEKRFRDITFHRDDSNPLAKFPVLTADDLRTALPPQNRDLLTSVENAHTVFQSGGSTGMPKTSLFTHAEMEMINLCNARGFFAVGLNAQDRVANLWAVGGLYMTFVHMNRMLQEYGCMSFPFSNQTPVDFVHTVAKLFDINCFTGITSAVLNQLREIDRREKGSLRLEKIFFGGEHIYEADRKEMEKKFGVQVIAAPGYGTVDSWYLGYQCQTCPNGVFHVFDDMVYLEVVDEETGHAAKAGESGMLYATVFVRRLTPIVRFRVGDRARWLERTCSCGRTSPLFELLGRGDDVLRIGYDSIDYASVQKIISSISGASGRMQMEKRRMEGRDELILRVETGAPAEAHPEMTEKLVSRFIQDRPSFSEFIKKGLVLPLKVEWCLEGSLPQNTRTGKLIRVIDAI